MNEYVIRETEDFFALSVFFRENGLGVLIEKNPPDRVLKMWRMDDVRTCELLAAVSLEKRDGVYALGDIAVKVGFRGKGYGEAMLRTVITEAKQRGVQTLWACAKEPYYYLSHGWTAVPWDSAPNIAVYCPTCERRGTDCQPEKMVFDVRGFFL